MSGIRPLTPVSITLTLMLMLAGTAFCLEPPIFILEWGSEGSGPGQFNWPSDIAADAWGNVFVADSGNHRVQRFDSAGNFLTEWGSKGSGNGQFWSPHGVAVDASGNVYVADTGNHRLQKFDSTGNFLRKWGSEGSGNGQFRSPYGVAADASGNVYVADTGNDRIQKFDSVGKYRTQWGTGFCMDVSTCYAPPGRFCFPQGVTVDVAGNVYVADTLNIRIQKFDSVGNHLTQWGVSGAACNNYSWVTGFQRVAADDWGNIYVSEVRIHQFDSSGNKLAKWGSKGSGPGQFKEPTGVTADACGNVYVADSGNLRIQKFGPAVAVECREMLDPSFGDFGRVTTKFYSRSSAYDLALQPDGKIVAAGIASGKFALARYQPDGLVDPTFGINGEVTTDFYGGSGHDDYAYSIALQPDGKVIAAGFAAFPVDRFALARYHTDGAPDTSFGDGGIVTTDFGQQSRAVDVLLQPDGRIVAVGYSGSATVLVRYQTDGTLDPSFGNGGKIVTPASSVASGTALQPDEKIVVLTHDQLFRYNPEGTLDASFGSGGLVTPAFGQNSGVTLQPDGKIVVVGYVSGPQPDDRASLALSRYQIDGSLDPSFGAGGRVTADFMKHSDIRESGNKVAVQPDGRIVAGGQHGLEGIFNSYDFALARFNPDGSVNEAFGDNGLVKTGFLDHDSLRALVLQPDGKVVAAGVAGEPGYPHFALARYDSRFVTIDQILPDQFLPGDQIEIIGSGFLTGSEIQVLFNGIAALVVEVIDDEHLLVTVPGISAAPSEVTVTVDGATATQAFAQPEPAPIPALSNWGILVLALLLMLAGAFSLNKRAGSNLPT